MPSSIPTTVAQFTVNDVGDPEPVIAATYCRRITVEESPFASGWPREWRLRAPLKGSPPRDKAAGASHVFEAQNSNRLFLPGQVVGHVETKSGAGSTTFNQYEE